MRVLGLDSATNVAGIAIVDQERLVAEFFLNTGKTHSQRLMPMLARLLAEADLTLADLDGLAVAIGPGSFTGLRIGLATVKGLAQVTGLPLVGVPTLDGLAWNAAGVRGIICPVLNARKQEVYTALYQWKDEELNRLTGYLAISPEQLTGMLAQQEGPVTLLGDGVPVYGDTFTRHLGERVRYAPKTHVLPRAAQVAELGVRLLGKGHADDLHALKPIYIRPSEAEARWAQRQRES